MSADDFKTLRDAVLGWVETGPEEVEALAALDRIEAREAAMREALEHIDNEAALFETEEGPVRGIFDNEWPQSKMIAALADDEAAS